MFKSTIQVTLFSLLGIFINFIIQLLLAYFFGATEERDAYFAALTIPTYISVLFTGSVGMLLVPFLVKYSSSHSNEDIYKFTSSVINFCALLLIALAIVAIIFSEPLMRIIVPTDKPVLLKNTIHLFGILMFSVIFTVLNNLLSSVLQARHFFFIPSLSALLTTTSSLLSVVFLSSKIGISSIAYGTLFGGVASSAFLLVSIVKKFKYRWSRGAMSVELKAILLASFPLFCGGILFRSTTVFERYFAARLPSGSLSYLGNGNQVIVILSTLVSTGIATTSFPLLSRYWSENNYEALEKTLGKVINMIALIIFPLITIFISCGKSVIKIVFEHGAFTSTDTLGLYYTLLGLMGFFLFGSIGNVVLRIFYIANYTRQVAIIGSLELAVYIISAAVLSRVYGYVGLALSMSIGSVFNIFVSLTYIRRRIIPISLAQLTRNTGTIFIVSALVLLPVFLLNEYWLRDAGSLLRCIATTILVLGLFWLIFIKILKDKYYISVIELIRNKI
jgi:putative peptidoglycan lipid II flippase